jgi:hypothetical protein
VKVSSYPLGLFAVLLSAVMCNGSAAQAVKSPQHADVSLVASLANDPMPQPFVTASNDWSSSASNAVEETNAVTGITALPIAPSALMFSDDSSAMFAQSQSMGTAPKHDKTIPTGWTAERLTARDKIIVGAKDLYSPENFLAIAVSAGYSHLTNGQPNYGVNSEAFAKRVGAAAVRETAQGVFTDMVFSPLLRQDPRYYVKGPQYGFFNRTMYAITRPLIGRTDGGRSTINASLLLGYAGAAALTPTFYPQMNRNFHDVASTYGGSIGGAALGFFVSEFSTDVLQAIHLKKQ